MPFFTTPSNYSLHYLLHGPPDAPDKVVLIIGFACCKSYWFPVIERLQAQTPPSQPPRYQILVFDSRGFGQSGDSLTARYSSSNMARDIKALLMHVNWIRPERDLLQNDFYVNSSREAAFTRWQAEGSIFHPPPLHIVGWSMGGMVATELTLDLVKWADAARKCGDTAPRLDFRSSVISASSRGGFTYRSDKHDADPLPEVASVATSSNASWTSSMLRRFLRRNRTPGRFRWNKTWFIRNIPPFSGLLLMFRCVFLSLYHSRIERVLELHYSTAYLDQPYVETSSASTPPASALSHLPLASAAMTSAAKTTLEVRADASTGGFSYKQKAAAEEALDLSDSDAEQGDSDREEDEGVEEVEEKPSQEELSKPVRVEMTPEQKQRVLLKEQEAENAVTRGETKEQARAESKVPEDLTQRPQRKRLQQRLPGATSLAASAAAMNNSAAMSTPVKPIQPAAAPASPASPRSNAPPSSSSARVLTNRDILSSQYLLRAPFDRYILLYAWALFGHFVTCVTHHVSRKRIREFMALQQEVAKRKEGGTYRLRMLVITGAADILVHPSNSLHLAELFDCPLYVLEGVGHMLHVEQPDAFAQLLHAHFTRTPIQHLQAVRQSSIPSSPAEGALANEGATNLTVTRMNAASTQQELGLTDEERTEIAARTSSSRRNSFLVQIDDPAFTASEATAATISGGTTTLMRRSSRSGLAASSPSLSSRSLSSTSSSSSASRRSGRYERRNRGQQTSASSCLTRCLVRVTSMPFRTAASCASLLLAAPGAAWHLAWHPTEVFSLPTKLFGVLKQQIGGAVLKRVPSTTNAELIGARGHARQPSARVLTN